MNQLHEDIAKVEAAIEKVEAKIEMVEKKLEAETLSENDVIYWREEKRQLRIKEDKLRTEKGQLRDEMRELRDEMRQLGRPPKHWTEENTELHRKMDLILEQTSTNEKATPQISKSQLGGLEKKKLQRLKRFAKFEERIGEDRILSAEESEAFSRMENEHQVVAFITPYLEKIFSDSCVFNSEEYRWLKTSDESSRYNERPDLFICHPAIVKHREPFKSRDATLNEMREQHAFKYGVLSDWRLCHAIGLTCEAKMKINDSGFGEAINYGAHLCFGKNGCTTTRLLLFDKCHCWLIGVVKGHVSEVTIFRWCDEGSTTLLREFSLRSPLIQVLSEACQYFQLTIGQDSFLGAGAFGFVFRATRADGKSLALKVVVQDGQEIDSVLRLEREKVLMASAHNVCPDLVMGVEEDGFTIFEDGATLLLSQVGDHYSKLDPQSIVDSLKTLHEKGLIHGDARLENVVCVDGNPIWIDFADSYLLPSMDIENMKEDELRRLKAHVAEKFDGYDTS